MKTKLKLVIFCIGLIILFLTNQNLEIVGRVKEINYFSSGISITLDTINEEFLIFDNKILDLKEEDKIRIEYKNQEYKHQKQNIIEKIIKLSKS